MHDPLGVGRRHGLGCLSHDLRCVERVQPQARQLMERRARHELLSLKRGSRSFEDELIEAGDPGVIKSREGPTLSAEALEVVGVCEVEEDLLDRDQALGAGVVGAVDHTHSPSTQLVKEDEATEPATRGSTLSDQGLCLWVESAHEITIGDSSARSDLLPPGEPALLLLFLPRPRRRAR